MNWEKLHKKIVEEKVAVPNKKADLKRKHFSTNNKTDQNKNTKVKISINESILAKQQINTTTDIKTQSADSTSEIVTAMLKEKVQEDIRNKYVALDCEMVGLGEGGKQSALARCSVVNFDGEKLYDEYVRPPGFVTDFRTQWSGIRKSDLRRDVAVTLSECQTAVAALLTDKILVGHALQNDLKVLLLSHPRRRIRDTAAYRPLMRAQGKNGKYRPRSLKDLCREQLKLTIQGGEHDPGEDARAAMMLYRLHRREWEAGLKAQRNASMTASGAGGSNKHSTVTGGDDQTSKTEGINLTSDEQKTSKTSRGLHLDRKGTKKGIDGSTGSTSMFAACSVDASGRALTSIASISSRKSSKKDVKK